MTQLFIRAAALAILAVTTAQAGDMQPATAVAKKAVADSPALQPRKARVAQNGEVDLAASTLSDAQLAAMRPHYEALKPRVRTNAE